MIFGWHDLIEVDFEIIRKRQDPVRNPKQGAVGTRQINMRVNGRIKKADHSSTW